jgi:hypothetical protein
MYHNFGRKNVSICHNYAKQGFTSVLIFEAVDEKNQIEEERKKEKEAQKIKTQTQKKDNTSHSNDFIFIIYLR